jgi:hypothetical protein
MSTLRLRLFWAHPDHPALDYGRVTEVVRRPGSKTDHKSFPGDPKKDPKFSLLPTVRIYLGRPLVGFDRAIEENALQLRPPEVTPRIGLGRRHTWELGEAELAKIAPKGTFELAADFFLELEPTNEPARKVVRPERLRCRTLSVRQTIGVQDGNLVPRRHLRGASPALVYAGLHPQLEWKAESPGSYALEIVTELLDVTPLVERFAAVQGADAGDTSGDAADRAIDRERKFRALAKDAKAWGYSIRYLLSTADAKKQWIWAAVVPDALGSGLNEEPRISCWMHYQAFPNHSYTNVTEIFDFEVLHRVRTPDSLEIAETLRAERWRAPIFLYSENAKASAATRRVWNNLETHVEASCGRLLAAAKSPWVLFWPLPDRLGALNAPDFGPAAHANLRRATRRGLRALQATGLVHPHPGAAEVRRLALSSHSGAVKGLLFSVTLNSDVDAVWLMDPARDEFAFPPTKGRWAGLWSWAASGRRYALVTWGYSFTRSDAKALAAQLKGEIQPAGDDFWNLWPTAPPGAIKPLRFVGKGGDPWWQEVCRDVLPEDELALAKEAGLVSTHQFVFFGGRTLDAKKRTRETWVEIFLRGVDELGA